MTESLLWKIVLTWAVLFFTGFLTTHIARSSDLKKICPIVDKNFREFPTTTFILIPGFIMGCGFERFGTK